MGMTFAKRTVVLQKQRIPKKNATACGVRVTALGRGRRGGRGAAAADAGLGPRTGVRREEAPEPREKAPNSI